MGSDRADALRRMMQASPDDPRPVFGLAAELERAGDIEGTVAMLRRYLELTDDEGNAWGRLGRSLARLGRGEEARDAYRTGIEAATAHGHPSMAAELEEELADLEAG